MLDYSKLIIENPFSRKSWGYINYIVAYSSAYPKQKILKHNFGFGGYLDKLFGTYRE